jgi:NAD(P)-dependent dehydrogenase (short-subunit alcohol dehydrogenase family)
MEKPFSETDCGGLAASKAGVLRLTESVAEEVTDAGVRLNAVLPTIIDTPRNRTDMPKADFARWAKPEEIAKAILFLLSDDAKESPRKVVRRGRQNACGDCPQLQRLTLPAFRTAVRMEC